MAAHLAYDMFSWNKYLTVNLVFFTPRFWSGNLFLIVPFPDLYLLIPFHFTSLHFHFKYAFAVRKRATATPITTKSII